MIRKTKLTKKPTVEMYRSSFDGRWVIHIDTYGGDNPEDEMRVCINDDIDNPVFGQPLVTLAP